MQVVRVKNRMDPEHDSTASGGYRDVAVRAQTRLMTPTQLHLQVVTLDAFT